MRTMSDSLPAAPRPDVLVVEDNPDGRQCLCMLLEAYGYRVASAEDGGEGIEKGRTLHPRAAVVDMGLPVQDGLTVGRELRDALHEDVLLIAHTAYCTPEWRERARRAGFDHFLCKPCDVDELVGLLG